MIFRAAFWLGAVWLCMPQHPDLSIPVVKAAAMSGDVLGSESSQWRQAVIRELVVFKKEVHADTAKRLAMKTMGAGAGGKTAQVASLSAAPTRH